MFAYPCPECGEELFAPDDEAGRQTLCPICVRPIRIPDTPPVSLRDLIGGLDPIDVDDSDTVNLSHPRPPTPSPIWRPPVLSRPEHQTPVTPPPELEPPTPPPSPTTAPEREVPPPAEQESPPSSEQEVPLQPEPEAPRPSEQKAPPPSTIVPRPPDPPRFSTPPHPKAGQTRQSRAEVSARLVTALTTKMRPAPTATPGIIASTAGWLIVTVAGLGLWAVSVATNPDGFGAVAGIGGIAAVAGGAWAAYTMARRPLLFVASGVGLLVLAGIGPELRRAIVPTEQRDTAAADPAPADVPGPVARLRTFAGRRTLDPLIGELEELSRPEVAAEIAPADRPAMARELSRLTTHERSAVRTAALAALMANDPASAEPHLLAALSSTDPGDRRAAIRIAPARPTPAVADAVAARFPVSDERPLARAALIRIGGPVAESAVLPLLKSDRQLVVIDAVEVLVAVGGPESLTALERLAATGPDLLIRAAVEDAVGKLAGRLRSGQPPAGPGN